MINFDEDFLNNLSSNPDEAFLSFEKYVREICLNPNNHYNSYAEIESKRIYIGAIIGFLIEYEIDMGLDSDIPNDTDDFNQFFNVAEKKINIYVSRMAIRAAKNKKFSYAYLLTPALKAKINHHTNLILEIINGVELTQNKRDELTRKLTRFIEEVNKDRTRGDLITSIYTTLKKDASAGADKINTALTHVVKIMDALSEAEEDVPKLQLPPILKRLEKPKKDLGSSKVDQMEDDIPF